MTLRRKLIIVTTGVTVLVAGLGLATTTAASASASTSACGAGFTLVGTTPLKSGESAGPAVLQVYWNSSSKQNCALTVHTGSAVGTAYSTQVKVKTAAATSFKSDTGSYRYYAGPVKLVSPGCIDVNGAIVVDKITYTASQKNAYCGSSAPTPAPTPAPKPTPPAPGAMAGFTAKTLTVDGVQRRYYVSVPAGVNGPLPTVIALYGMHATPAWIADSTGLHNSTSAAKIALIVPVSEDGIWNDGRLGAGGPKDQAFLMDIVTAAVADKVADAKHITISGFSNGAEMALTMASLHPSTFSAVVSISGELPSAAGSARPTGPIPAYFSHGLADPVQPYGGRTAKNTEVNGLISEDATVALFVAADRAQAPKSVVLANTNVQRVSYTAGAGGAPVMLYKLPGVGHVWPTAATSVGTNVVATGFDASALIVRAATSN